MAQRELNRRRRDLGPRWCISFGTYEGIERHALYEYIKIIRSTLKFMVYFMLYVLSSSGSRPVTSKEF